MDDYRDLVAASLALVCAGVMLVAGQLYIEHRPSHPPSKSIEAPPGPGAPPMVSHGPSLREKMTEPRENGVKERPT